MLDCPGSQYSFFKELTLMCSGNEDCTVHLKHGIGETSLDDYVTYRVPVRRARRFIKNGNVDYKSMHEQLNRYGYSSNTRRNFIQNFHGLYDNCCTPFPDCNDLVKRIEAFVDICKHDYKVNHVVYMCFNSFISRSFSKLTNSFARPEWGHVICCMNSIPPLIRRSPMYDFRRCVYHMKFPSNYSNSVLDRDPCARAVMREVYSNNFDKLVKQISLFFDRCANKYFPKKDRTLCVSPNANKTLFLSTELSPLVLQELFSDVTHKKSVSIDVKKDILLINTFNK